MADTRVKRSQVAAFLNTGTTETPVWSRIGKGVIGQTITYNPQVTTETYINEDNATTSLTSYQVNIATPQTAYAGDPVFDFVDALRQARAVGDDAEVEVLLVYLYTTSPYRSEKNTAVIQIDDFGGDGGTPVVINYTLNLNGDPIVGTSTITSGLVAFTAS
ncbi:hypothetical protein AAFA46_08090 [Oscillospiraceae bacterium WX1]